MRHLPGLAFVVLALLPFLLEGGKRPVASTAAGTAGAADEDAQDADAEWLIIVSPHRRELREEYSRAFPEYMARAHGRRVRIGWRDPGGGTQAIVKDLASRHEQKTGPGADLFFGGGARPHQDAKKAGWLAPAPMPAEILAAIPPAVAGQPVYDPEGHWYGVALASFGIVYDAGLVSRLGEPAPREWADLAAPAYRGWLASGDPQRSGVVHTCYQTVLQAYGFERGWRLLAAMAANTRVFGDGAATAPTEVAAGDAAAGLSIEDYALTAIRNAGDPDLMFVRPPGLTLVNADAISLLKGGPNPELARRFIEYCLSEEGQTLLLRPAGVDGQLYSQRRLPVRADLYESPYAPPSNPYAPADGARPFAYDEALASLRQPVLNDMAATWLIDTHGYLAAAWRAVAERGFPPGEVDALFAPPLDADAAAALGARWNAATNDPVERDRIVRERVLQRRAWSIEARARYRAIKAGASTQSML